MKKIIAVILIAVLSLSLFAGCSKSDTIKVAIVQQLDHSSLDEIRTAAENRLSSLAEEAGMKLEIEVFNGQNDATLLNQIGTQIVSDQFNMIIPIATTAAQIMVSSSEGTNIPIVYAAISDPEAAGLTNLAHVTGVSDALNTPFILDMMLAVQPDVKAVGLLYSTSEINSLAPVAQAKAYLETKGIEVIEKTGTNSSEIIAAANSLVGRVDAVFTPTDNVVMSAEAAVAEVFNANGIAHYTGADSFVLSGGFATCGVNYTELGEFAADMAFFILEGGPVSDYHIMDGGIITVNKTTAAALGIDYSAFNDMANTVIEVE